MVVLRPGDKVLVVLDSSIPDEDVRDTNKGLGDAFPGVEFVVMNGVEAIAFYAQEANQSVRDSAGRNPG